MLKPTSADIRETVLKVIQDLQPKNPTGGESLQQQLVLNEVAKRLEITYQADLQLAVLVLWNDLFRTGYLGWGLNLNNPNPPFFHVTERGRRALERLSRDPGNPAGYLKHLFSIGTLNPVAQSYLVEGLECFVGGLHKAAAVMLGASAESIVLEVRDTTVQRITSLGSSLPKPLLDWKLKTVLDALNGFLGSKTSQMPRDLRDQFDSYWPAFTQQIRATRNDAGHPVSVDPVTPDGVHASFMVFPELSRLATRLNEWIAKELK
jgi:hypothetical protein